MADFVEVTRQGFGSRGKDSLGGAIFGVVLVVVGCILLFWNEGRAVKRYKDLKAGAAAFVNADSSVVDQANEGKLVHLTGEAEVEGQLKDADFGVSEAAIKLRRSVEMYQWVENVENEEKNKVGGGTETTKRYTYATEWRNGPVDSSQFKVTEGHLNPGSLPYQNSSQLAEQVSLGAFRLPRFLVEIMGGETFLPLEGLEKAAEAIQTSAQISEGRVYLGNNPASPVVGDVRISFYVERPGPISVIAQQSQDSLVKYATATGNTLELLERGIVPAEQMFEMAKSRNSMMTWAIRVFGFVLLGIAFSMILRPIVVLASILPFLGRLVGAGTGIVSFILAGIVWAVVVAVAWIFYRPVLGIAILAVAVGLIVWFVRLLAKSGNAAEVASSDAPPPLDSPPPLN